jgi:hypothetical protein
MSLGYNVNFYEELDTSTRVYDAGGQHYLSVSAGITQNIEAGAVHEFHTGSSTRRNRMYWTLKYQMPSDSFPAALSFVIPGSKKDYSTAMASFGWSAFYFGVGTNFGGRKLEELNLTTLNDFGTSLFGGYRLRSVLANRNVQANQTLVEGSADGVFGFAGGQVPLGQNINFVYDYNGDVFSGGFRLTLDTSTFHVGYVSEGDYDKLFGRRQNNVIAGMQYRF